MESPYTIVRQMRLCRVTILRYLFSLSRHYHNPDSEPCFHEPKYFSLEFEWTIIFSLIDIFRSTLLLLSYRPFFRTGRLTMTRIHLICQYGWNSVLCLKSCFGS